MKIVSKYTDYYDTIAWTFGGGDPKIRYERDKFNTNMVSLPSGMKRPFRDIFTYSSRRFEQRNLVVGDKIFTLFRDSSDLHPGPFKLLLESTQDEILKHTSSWSQKELKEFVKVCQFQKFPEDLMFVTRAIGNPIYLIRYVEWDRSGYTIHIEDKYVPLFNYGLQGIYPPDQIYQDLSYFLANKMSESPDLQPAGRPPQTDKEKIVSHGMDLKTSFRHRK